MYLVKAFSRFSFTPNVLMYSGLRKVGEAVKAINENLLTCGYVQAYAYARSARRCARSFIGEEDGKVGRNEKESGRGSEEGGVNEERKGNQWKIGRWCRA